MYLNVFFQEKELEKAVQNLIKQVLDLHQENGLKTKKIASLQNKLQKKSDFRDRTKSDISPGFLKMKKDWKMLNSLETRGRTMSDTLNVALKRKIMQQSFAKRKRLNNIGELQHQQNLEVIPIPKVEHKVRGVLLH